MRSTPITLGSALVLGALVGCSETPPPVAPVAIEPAPPAHVASGPVDLAPVAEPADIFVTARWKSPNATLAGLSACAGVPESLSEQNARFLVDKALANAFRGGVDGRQIADIIAYDAPVDLVVSLDTTRRTPNVLFSFGVGLTSFDRAKKAIEGAGELVEVAPGLYRVGEKDAGELTCAIGAAAGSAPARLICGKREKDVATLGPYLARNLPVAEAPKTDVHAEVRFTPIDARYGGDIRRGLAYLPNLVRAKGIGEPRFDKALEEAAQALADEGAALAGDLDRISFDLGVDGASCLTARTALQLRGKTSWIAGAIADNGAKAGPPPAIFWRAPIDSDSASYGHAMDATRYGGIFRTLRTLLEGVMAKEKIGSDADRKALAALINLPFGKDTNVVVASGHAQGQSKNAPAGGKLTEQQIADEIISGSLGWTLVGFDEGPEALTKLIKDVVAVYNRKGLTDPLRKELGKGARALPVVKIVAAPRELGRGSMQVDLKFAIEPKKSDKPIAFTLHVLVMADGKSTWLGIGANRDDLVKHLLKTKTGAPDGGTLATRQGLEPLRSGKAVSSGFFTMSVLTRGIGSILGNPALTSQAPARVSGPMEEVARALANLPHKGDTPIFVVSDASGTGPRSELSLQVQKGTFEDVGVLVMTGLRLANQAGVLPAPAKP